MAEMWSRETVYFSGDEYFHRLLEAIDQAQHSIQLEVYIFEKGVIGDRFVHHLTEAAARGVKCSVLIDGIGSPGFAKHYLQKLRRHRINVRFYRALPWLIQRLPGEARLWIYRMNERLKRFNKGNHRKFFLIDEKKLFVGSFNISDVHSETESGPRAWKDIGAEVEGPEVSFVRKAFHRAFRLFRLPQWSLHQPKLVLLNDSFIQKRNVKLQKIQRLKAARTRIWISTPYFVPPGHILRYLARSAKRRADVKIVVPQTSDVWIVQWMSLGIIHHLSQRGVQIYFYKPRFNHQKLFIIDDWMCLGSTNLNHRSFLHDLEMDIVITYPANKHQLERAFLADLADSKLYEPAQWPRQPLVVRWVGYLLLMLRYWA